MFLFVYPLNIYMLTETNPMNIVNASAFMVFVF